METVIKGLHLLSDVDRSVINEIEKLALLLGQNFAVKFKIKQYSEKDVTIQVAQVKATPEYPEFPDLGMKGLVKMVNLEFGKFFPGRKILPNPIPYVSSPVSKVNSKWIQDKMLTTGTRLKDLVAETGINKSYLSNLTNGVDPLSDIAKAMFYFYFRSKEIKDES